MDIHALNVLIILIILNEELQIYPISDFRYDSILTSAKIGTLILQLFDIVYPVSGRSRNYSFG